MARYGGVVSIHAQRFIWLIVFGAALVTMTYALQFPGWIIAAALVLGVVGGLMLKRKVDRG